MWKYIDGYEGLYQISDTGEVMNVRTGKILKATPAGAGYLFVNLSKNGDRKNYYIHRLVASAFIPNPLNLPEVNHKDEDKTNNNVENLEFCDHKYNINYGTRNERDARKQSKPVLQYTIDGTFIREWESITEAQRNGFHSGTIINCCRGKKRYKTHKGYVWKYKEV